MNKKANTKDDKKSKRKTKKLLKWISLSALSIGGAVMWVAFKKNESKSEEHDAISRVLNDDFERTVKEVDEDIFTNLAPAIEEAVLDKDIEKIWYDRSYDLGDNLHKFVTVNIENIYGD